MSYAALICIFLAGCGGGNSSGGGAIIQANGNTPAFVPPAGITAHIEKIDTSACPELAVYLTVNDENSLPVLNLDNQNFEVLDDGVSQIFDSFYREIVTESIVFSMALDYSLSLEDPDIWKVEEAASYFINELFSMTNSNQLDNWGEIIKFVQNVQLMQEFTKIKSDLLTGITTVSQDRINGKKNTGLYDAIGYSINRLTEFRNNSPESIPEKSVLIVITDGLDNASVVYTKYRRNCP